MDGTRRTPAGKTLSRRALLLGGAAATLAGCQSTSRIVASARRGRFGEGTYSTPAMAQRPAIDPVYRAMYGPILDERFPIPAVDIRQFEPQFLRREVPDPTREKPGTIVVDTTAKFLYLVQDDGTAMRYGVGLGRAGFGWDGTATIRRKAKWPTWTPPAEMIEREPELEEWRNGMPPGPQNPLGARALYLYQGGVDTLYRLHGTMEAYSIGRNVSSGCVRLLNHDVIDLYNRTPTGATVIVRRATIY